MIGVDRKTLGTPILHQSGGSFVVKDEAGYQLPKQITPNPSPPPPKTRGEWLERLLASAQESPEDLLGLDVTLSGSLSDFISAERHLETYIAAAALQEREACSNFIIDQAKLVQRRGGDVLGLFLRRLALRIQNGHVPL